MNAKTEKSLVWIGSSKKDLLELPQDIVKSVGYTLHFAQKDLTPPNVKPLSGFHGAGVLEVIENHDGNTYRAIYTLRLSSYGFVVCGCSPNHVVFLRSSVGRPGRLAVTRNSLGIYG